MAHVDDFLRHLEISRAASPHTLKAYAQDLKAFLEYLEPQKVEVEKANHLHIRGFLGVQSVTLAPASRARRLAGLKAFFKFLTRRKVIEVNPARALPVHLANAEAMPTWTKGDEFEAARKR